LVQMCARGQLALRSAFLVLEITLTMLSSARRGQVTFRVPCMKG
jgi:hypothetical protein